MKKPQTHESAWTIREVLVLGVILVLTILPLVAQVAVRFDPATGALSEPVGTNFFSSNYSALTNSLATWAASTNITKAQVGLGNVDNTSDADKPVSTATQTALNLKLNAARLLGTNALTVGNAGTAATLTGTETLTNKTLSAPVFSGSATGTLSVASDTDATTTLGRTRLFSRVTDDCTIAHLDNATISSWQLSLAQNGNTYINAKTGGTVQIYNNAASLVASFGAGQIAVTAAGSTPGAPSIAWNGDTNTGIYPTTADTINFSTGGTRRGGFNSSGNVDFSGNATVTGSLSVGGGTTLASILSATASLDFDLSSTATEDLTITVTGASVGDTVAIGVPNASIVADAVFMGWVSATDTVTVRAMRIAGTPNPASGTFRATVIKF